MFTPSMNRFKIRYLTPPLPRVFQILGESAKNYIKQYVTTSKRMQGLADELSLLSKQVIQVQGGTLTAKMIGVFLGVLGILVIASVLTTREIELSVIVRAKTAAGGLLLGLAGFAITILAHKYNRYESRRYLEKAEMLGRGFMAIVDQLKDDLITIKEASNELDESSSWLSTKFGHQVEALLNTTKLESLVAQTHYLKIKFTYDDNVYLGVREIFKCFLQTQDEKEFEECVTNMAFLCQKRVTCYAAFKFLLRDFEKEQLVFVEEQQGTLFPFYSKI